MTQADKAKAFAGMHKKGEPVVLYNIWDAGSAKVLADAGAKAVATGSAPLASAQGYPDGQKIPLEMLLTIARRIVETVDVPVSIDFEGAYAVEPEEVAANVTRLIETGAIGLNFEDQVVGGEGLHDIKLQQERIRAIRAAGEAAGVPIAINARTDLFLKERDAGKQPPFMSEAKERAAAYAEAGATSFFAPGLLEADLISELCADVALPVNIIALPGAPSNQELADLGVARISYGPVAYKKLMAQFGQAFEGLG